MEIANKVRVEYNLGEDDHLPSYLDFRGQFFQSRFSNILEFEIKLYSLSVDESFLVDYPEEIKILLHYQRGEDFESVNEIDVIEQCYLSPPFSQQINQQVINKCLNIQTTKRSSEVFNAQQSWERLITELRTDLINLEEFKNIKKLAFSDGKFTDISLIKIGSNEIFKMNLNFYTNSGVVISSNDQLVKTMKGISINCVRCNLESVKDYKLLERLEIEGNASEIGMVKKISVTYLKFENVLRLTGDMEIDVSVIYLEFWKF
jgi:serine/threonine protein kinase